MIHLQILSYSLLEQDGQQPLETVEDFPGLFKPTLLVRKEKRMILREWIGVPITKIRLM